MSTLPEPNQTAPFNARFFPQQVLLLTTGNNLMPMGYWTVISKDPFRFLICMGVGNHSLGLLRETQEAALHFMPWTDRERVARAGYLSGRDVNKAEKLGFELQPAEKLKHTRLVAGADVVYETVIHSELADLSREFVPFVLDVLAAHGKLRPQKRQPILYLSLEDFATVGDKWQYKK